MSTEERTARVAAALHKMAAKGPGNQPTGNKGPANTGNKGPANTGNKGPVRYDDPAVFSQELRRLRAEKKLKAKLEGKGAKWLRRAGMAAAGVGGAAALINNADTIRKALFKPSLTQQLIGPGSKGRQLAGLAAVAGAAGLGLSAADKVSEEFFSGRKRDKNFRMVMRENPDLSTKENERDVKKMFHTLHTFAPAMAADPLTAGSFLRRSLMFKSEGIQSPDVKTLAEITKNLAEAKNKQQSSPLKSLRDSTLQMPNLRDAVLL